MTTTSLQPSTDAVRQLINPNSVSFETILADLYTDLEARPDGQQWSSRFRGGVGTTLIEWIAAVNEDLKVAALVGARESSLQTARNRVNIIRLATDYGYVVNRQTAARLSLGVNAVTSFVLDPLMQLGIIDNTPVYPVEATIVPVGLSNVPVIFGVRYVSSEKLTTSTEAFNGVSWTAAELNLTSIDQIDNADDTLEVYVNGFKRTITSFPEALAVVSGNSTLLIKNLGDEIQIVSGFDGIDAGQPVVLRYVKVQAVQATSDSVAIEQNIAVTYSADAAALNSIITNFVDSDSNKKIATLAPGFNFSNRKAVTKGDYEVIINAIAGVASAKWHEGTCATSSGESVGHATNELLCSVDGTRVWTSALTDTELPFAAPVAVLFDDQAALEASPLLLAAAKDAILLAMDAFKFEGSRILLIDPVKTDLVINLQIDLSSAVEQIDTTSLSAAVDVFASSLVGELGGYWKPAQLVQAVSKFEGVLHCYINSTTTGAQTTNELKANTNQYFSVTAVNITYKRDGTDFLSTFG